MQSASFIVYILTWFCQQTVQLHLPSLAGLLGTVSDDVLNLNVPEAVVKMSLFAWDSTLSTLLGSY